MKWGSKLPEGTRAVVTGGGSGLGRALCIELAKRRSRVMVADLNTDAAAETVDLMRCAAGNHIDAVSAAVDVAELVQMQALEEQMTGLWGGTDFVANNAGVAVAGPFEEISTEHWRWIVDVNLWGVLHGCQVFMPAMRRRGHGYVLNVASAAGLTSFPEISPYNVTKAGVVALSETLNGEYKSDGVNVSVLCPTFFHTNIMNNARGPVDGKKKKVVGKLMDRAQMQAPEVARRAIDGVAKGRLYVVPMRDGRLLWRSWRLAPERFHELLASGAKRFRGPR